MKTLDIEALRNMAADGSPIDPETALAILQCDVDQMPAVMAAATEVRTRHFGNRVHLCSILNAKSGACDEDCAFCAQAGVHCSDSDIFGLRSEEEILSAYDASTDLPIGHFGVVTSGGALSDADLDHLVTTIEKKQRENTHWCASLGCLNHTQLQRLKDAGLRRFHHNLETAESYFPSICTTHTYAQRLETARAVKDVGMQLCCGGILGLGETLAQRVEFAEILQREKVDAIPLNFLIPVEGTALEHQQTMKPWDILRAIAMFRLINPAAELKICAGRLLLRDLQSMIFQAGATGMMVGELLTIAGRDMTTDLQMLKDLEVTYEW